MGDAAIATVVTGFVTITTLICGVITLWIKLRENNQKIDANTKLTKEGTSAAAANAETAANAASVAAEKASSTESKIVGMLNGAMDTRIHAIVKEHFEPLSVAVKMHAEQDEKNMKEIRQALGELRDRIK